MNTPDGDITDAHEIHVRDLLERAGIKRETLCKHEKAGYIARGKKRPGVQGHFWTKREANIYLKKRGLRDKQFD